MFVEPAPGSGFDKVAPAVLLRRIVRFLSRNRNEATDSSQRTVYSSEVQQPQPPSRSRKS